MVEGGTENDEKQQEQQQQEQQQHDKQTGEVRGEDESFIYPLPLKPTSVADIDVGVSSTPAFQCLDEVSFYS